MIGGMDSDGLRIVEERCDLDDRESILRELRAITATSPAGLEHWIQPAADRAPDESVPSELIDEAVTSTLRAIQRLVVDQNARLDRAGLERLTLGVEKVRRAAEAATVAAAERVMATNPFRADCGMLRCATCRKSLIARCAIRVPRCFGASVMVRRSW